MQISGKFKVIVKEGENIVNMSEGHNLVTDDGLSRIKDWMLFNGYSSGYYPSIKQIDATGMTVTSAGFSNAGNAVDSSDATLAYATINNASWDNIWWKIDFGESKTLAAIYVDWAENDVNYGADYKFQYSSDNVTWYDFETRLRPPQEADVRGKVMFFVKTTPPYSLQTGVRYLRLNTKRGNDDEGFSLYSLKFYEPNFIAQPPMVIKIGDGTVAPSGQQTDLQGSNTFAKLVSGSASPSGYISRYIMSLTGDEGNGITFAEAGLFFASGKELTQSASNVDKMFSRGLFSPTWSKTVGQTADVYYEIEVSNS